VEESSRILSVRLNEAILVPDSISSAGDIVLDVRGGKVLRNGDLVCVGISVDRLIPC
jgi:hypothetical protein